MATPPRSFPRRSPAGAWTTGPSVRAPACAGAGDAAISPALVIGRDLRRAGVACEVDGRGQSLKSQLRRANSRGARLALVVGEGELARGVVQLKDLAAHEQLDVATDTIVGAVRERLEKVVAP